MYVFHSPKDYSFEKVGIKGKNFDTKVLFEEAKFTVIETTEGHQTRIRERECTFVYFILDGKGSFEIGKVIENCRKGDLEIVPKNTIFTYTGKMKILLVTFPWWYSEQEETLQDKR